MTRIWNCFTRLEKAIFLGLILVASYFAGGFFGLSKSAEALPPVFEPAPHEKPVSGSAKSAAFILVHVSGAVKKPGVLRVPQNARVQDAVKLAGGASEKADLNALNLAQKLSDGEQVLVRARGEIVALDAAATSTPVIGDQRSTSSVKRPARPVRINAASLAELQTLPGIGPKTASQILAQRAKKPFRSLEDLDEVKGLGPKKLEKLKPFVVF